MPNRSDGEDQKRVRELTALYAVAAALNQAINEQDALTGALDRLLDVLDLDSGHVFLLDRSTPQLTLVTARGDPPLFNPAETSLTPDHCLCGMALERAEALHAADVRGDVRVVGECRRLPDHACVTIPLLAQQGMLGVLHLAGRRNDGFSEGELALLRSVGAQMGVGVENMRLREGARRAEALAVLIQEMHHRIKNNLQTVADLLSLEAANTGSPEARKSLHDSIGRIKSIAAVHQLLSAEQLRVTDITELSRQVCTISSQHMVRRGCQLQISVTGPPIFLPSKQATALALVINEMVANAFEHGFPDGRSQGEVTLTLSQDGDRVTMTIEDNGCGLPEGFDLERSQGLGLRIVRTLVERDLAGSLRLENTPAGGARGVLTFYQ